MTFFLAASLLALVLLIPAAVIARQATGSRRLAASLSLVLALICGMSWVEFTLHAGEQAPTLVALRTAPDADDQLQPPEGWPEGYPLPQANTNCVRCHITAGRELSIAVLHFSHSVHDLNYLSCADCHGGNTEDDAKAHDPEFGFIGTKLSSHIATCSECHSSEAEYLAAGTHAWDWSQRINLDYPMCIDCHGNHDVGNPPADFKLKEVCLDCHDDLDKDFPHITSVIDHNDKLWAVLGEVRRKNQAEDEPVPMKFQDAIDTVRERTMRYVHECREIEAADAGQLNQQADAVRAALEDWLKSADQ